MPSKPPGVLGTASNPGFSHDSQTVGFGTFRSPMLTGAPTLADIEHKATQLAHRVSRAIGWNETQSSAYNLVGRDSFTAGVIVGMGENLLCHPERGTPDEADGSDYYYAFASHEEARACSTKIAGAETPLALVLQLEYVDEAKAGEYRHVRERRVAEWPVEFLSRPRRTSDTIPKFLAPGAPPNRLEILRGTVKQP